jgi:hypothetical protein
MPSVEDRLGVAEKDTRSWIMKHKAVAIAIVAGIIIVGAIVITHL